MLKPRILVCGDTSTGNTGLGRYKRDLLNGLNEAGRFQIAEFAHAGTIKDKHKVPWQYYPIAPDPLNPKENEEYSKNSENAHGKWRYEKCLLHFKPHIVITPLDPWQMTCQAYSPLKPFYHLISSPTVDSAPAIPEYLDLFNQADTLITYSEFGFQTINSLKVANCISMGVDETIFVPVQNKKLHKQSMGLPADSIIFGFVARNNPRKRFPELLDAFKIFLEKNPDKANNSFLCLHTTHPDKCWDFAAMLADKELYHKVYFSYKCTKTNKVFVSLFKDKVAESPYGPAGNVDGRIINTHNIHITDDQLCRIYNLFDLYVHAATNEGFGVPIIEAAACNIPIAYIPYSAMEELGSKMGGIRIPFELTMNYSTKANVAYVNPVHLYDAMQRFINNPISVNSRKTIKTEYTTKLFVERWISLIDSINIEDLWSAPYRKVPETKLGSNNTFSEIISLINKPFKYRWGWKSLKELKGLNLGIHPSKNGWMVTTPEVIVNRKTQEYTEFDQWEKIRLGINELKEEEWMKR